MKQEIKMIHTNQTLITRHTHFPNSGMSFNVSRVVPIAKDRPSVVASVVASVVDGLKVMPKAHALQNRQRKVAARPWRGGDYSLASAIAFGIGFAAISALTLEA
jgi:hypothetical protein